ncbi:hypothetical protein [Pedobacter sp. SYSU D00535]|uniref:hypothetical protein n=1 Tax=Pedobacter sp. SYSU D00535 TaxID=2810308 RepID=UPI001A973B3A|nr:hypothetical protein [Pedobacter sp. SYSU D00535]
MKQLFLISHDTQTAVKAGKAVAGIPYIEPEQVEALNAFLTLNHLKNIVPVWDDDDDFEEILDSYTFITTEDARNSIYSQDKLG